VTSVWPGYFGGWVILFFLAGVSGAIASAWILFQMVTSRRRALGPRDARGPRHAAMVWLDGSTGFTAVLALVSMRETATPLRLLVLVAETAPWFLAVYWVSRIVLKELPAQLEPLHEPLPRVRVFAIVLLRILSGGVILLLCASSRALDGVPPGDALLLAGMALLGGLHLTLQSALRELPRGARTLWFGALAAVLAGVAVGAVELRLPRRAAFEVYRGRFDRCAANGADGLQRVGPWRVTRAEDPRGGVFFATWSEQEQVDSDGVQYVGFAFRPNGAGTPFGDWGVEFTPLGGEWFEFVAWGPD